MSLEDQIIRVLVSGATINGTAANANKTTDAVPMLDRPWSLVFSFSSLSVTGAYPTVRIQGSNDPSTGTNSWVTIYNGGPHVVPNTFESSKCRFRFLRLVYLANGATAGTINCHIVQKKLV